MVLLIVDQTSVHRLSTYPTMPALGRCWFFYQTFTVPFNEAKSCDTKVEDVFVAKEQLCSIMQVSSAATQAPTLNTLGIPNGPKSFEDMSDNSKV